MLQDLQLFYLSCCTMRDKLGSLPACDLHQLAGDAGPCDGRAQQVSVLINGIGLHGWPDEVLHKLCTHVFNENLGFGHMDSHEDGREA